jgi:PAS domain S-box-containing protein
VSGKEGSLLSRILLLLFFLQVGFLHAEAEQLPIKTYTTADGLGSSFISNLMRDSRGFMWFCTRDGLSRFDGSRFVTYQVGDQNSPPGIEQILETRKGIYWIVTSGGLYRFDPNSPSTHKTQDANRPTLNAGLVSELRGVLYEDRNSNLWMGGNSLYRLEEKDGKVTQYEVELNLPLNTSVGFGITAFCEGQDGSLWLATNWGLVRRLPDGREIFFSVGSSSADGVTSVLEDRGGRIWFGRASGFCVIKPEALDELATVSALTVRKLDGEGQELDMKQSRLPDKSGEIIKYIDHADAFADKFVYQTSDGHVWISNGDGVVEYDGHSFNPHTIAQGIQKGVGLMAEDAGGNLWLGWTTGLMRLDRRGLTTYNVADGLKNLSIQVINESPDGKLYVASANFYLSQFDGRGFQTIRPQVSPNERALWLSSPFFQDHTGEWWVLTNEKLYRFAAAETFNALAGARPLATYTSRDGLKSDRMFRIFEDSKDDLWISVRGGVAAQYGLSRWNHATQKFYTFSEADGFPSGREPASFAEDRDGNLWFGFYEGGLARYTQGRFTVFTAADGMPDGVITDLHLDRQGRLWLASALNGLSRIDDTSAAHPRFTAYTTDNGLASNNVRAIAEDLYGNIYAGTARGVDKISPEAGRVQHYSVKDGLAGDFVNVAFRDRSGALWFGTQSGLSRLVPEEERSAAAPPVLLGGLRIAGESRFIPELGSVEISDLELAHTQNNLQLDFFGVDFSAGAGLRYQYMLEGADRDWSQPTTQQTVNYANLAPGSYRFLVRAVNADGASSQRPATVSFRVLSPFWRRGWFLALAALAIGLTVFALDRYRVNRMKELDAALTESQQLTETLTEQRSELSKANRTLELEYEVTSILAESTTPAEAAPKILEVICRSTTCDIGAIWYVDEEPGRLRCQEVWHSAQLNASDFETRTLAQTFVRGEGLPGRVWERGESQWIVELEVEANFPRLAAAHQEGLKSAFGFPITLEGEVIGVLEFFSVERRERDNELLEMMSNVGGQIGQLIERRRADEALRESEDRFRTLAETASDAIITIDEESRIVYVNEAAEHVFGYSIAEMLGADLTILMPEYLRHLHEAGLNRYIETGHKHIGWEAVELPGLHRSGREIPLELSFGEFTKNNQRFFTGIARDVTERKQAEEALQRSREERLRELERVRTRIATDLHDDIGSSLTQIVVLSEVARQRVDGNDGLLAEPLTKITRVSNELVEAMSDIVWAINPKKDHLSDLVQRMRRFASDIFAPCQIRLNLRTHDTDGQIQLGANVRREVFLIFKESVNNIAKHSGCTEARVEFYPEDGSLVLKLIDNGKGFDVATVSEHTHSSKGGNGLISMHRRAQELGGSFEITSNSGQGTSTTLKVPLGQPSQVDGSHPNGR